jgi:hypothetical protein
LIFISLKSNILPDLRHVTDAFSRNPDIRISRFPAKNQKLPSALLVQVFEADEARQEGRFAAAAGTEEAVTGEKA